MSDPNRRLSGGANPDDLPRSALGSANDDGPSSEEVARLTGQLASLLPAGALATPTAATPASGAPTEPPPVSPAGAGTAGLFSAKWLAGALAMGAVAGASIHAAVTPVVPVASSPSAAPPTYPSASSMVFASPESSVPLVAVSALPLAVSPAVPVSSATVRPRASASAANASLPEPELLDRAHDALLHSNPEKALTLTREHARAYPQGVLAQEREMIAIEALLVLSRHDEAKTRAAAFRTAYPGSSHIARLDAMLGSP